MFYERVHVHCYNNQAECYLLLIFYTLVSDNLKYSVCRAVDHLLCLHHFWIFSGSEECGEAELCQIIKTKFTKIFFSGVTQYFTQNRKQSKVFSWYNTYFKR